MGADAYGPSDSRGNGLAHVMQVLEVLPLGEIPQSP